MEMQASSANVNKNIFPRFEDFFFFFFFKLHIPFCGNVGIILKLHLCDIPDLTALPFLIAVGFTSEQFWYRTHPQAERFLSKVTKIRK